MDAGGIETLRDMPSQISLKSVIALLGVALVSAILSGGLVWTMTSSHDRPKDKPPTDTNPVNVVQQTPNPAVTPATNAPSAQAPTATPFPSPANPQSQLTTSVASPGPISSVGSPSPTVATAAQTESQLLDIAKLAANIRPAVALLSIYDDKGKLVKTGTAFFTSRDGRLVTNWHVIEGAVRATAKLENGATYTVTGIHNFSADRDLALLQAEATDVPFLTVSRNPLPQVGTRIAVIGSPLGLEGTVSEGIISGQRALSKKDHWLQMTAPVSPGSSGSPVVDRNGEVLGVATFLIRESQALNFARPAEYVAQLVESTSADAEPKPLWTRSSQPQNPATADSDFAAVDKALAENDAITALKLLNTLALKHSEEAILWFKFGYAYDKLGLYEDAVTAYEKALKILPTNGIGWTNMAISLSKLKRWNEAAKAGREAIKIAPDYPQAWALLGFVAFEENKFRDAIGAFEKAAQLKPDDAENWRWLSICYSRVGNVQKMNEADLNWKHFRSVSPPTNASTGEADRFTQLVARSLTAFEQHDVAASMEKYADHVNYYEHGIVDRNFITKDLQDYHSRWPVLKIRLSSPVEVTDTINADDKKLTFTYKFEASTQNRNRVSAGSAWNEWIVSTSGGDLKVTSENQKVTGRR